MTTITIHDTPEAHANARKAVIEPAWIYCVKAGDAPEYQLDQLKQRIVNAVLAAMTAPQEGQSA